MTLTMTRATRQGLGFSAEDPAQVTTQVTTTDLLAEWVRTGDPSFIKELFTRHPEWSTPEGRAVLRREAGLLEQTQDHGDSGAA